MINTNAFIIKHTYKYVYDPFLEYHNFIIQTQIGLREEQDIINHYTGATVIAWDRLGCLVTLTLVCYL